MPSPATSISDFRAEKHRQGLETQSFLQNSDDLKLLRDNVKVTNTEITLPEVKGHSFPLRIYEPANHSHALPLLLYFHGGYWCGGDANSEDLGCRAIITHGTDIVIASFAYRLSPEHAWDDVLSDAEFAMKWMASNAESFGANVSKGFLVGGAEAGSHLASICAIRAKNRYPNIIITGQVLIVPVTVAWPDEDGISGAWKSRLQSHTEMRDAPLFNSKSLSLFMKNLNVPQAEARKGENFPVWADLRGLPPAYIPMDECDPIRDQAFLYAELLAEAGVKTRTDFYRGLPNMFVQFPKLKDTAMAGIHLSSGVKWLLQGRK